jgi:murein DD-endopeptidase MepM/ murein hydrolase activator NlpD
MVIARGLKALAVLGAMVSLAACASYPREPRYSIYADGPAGPAGPAAAPTYPPPTAPSGEGVRGATNPATEAPPPATAPVERIEGGALDAPLPTARPSSGGTQPAAGPASEGFTAPPPPARGTAVGAGTAYEIQPGDTLSGVGRRFRTPVQSLIDLNQLGPRGAIAPGQRIALPDTAVDGGIDPYATGPSPTGVLVPNDGVAPPPPPPPVATAPVSGSAATPTVSGLDWPVRGDILRRFGPVGMGERNNGVNIGAPAGAEVRTAAAGRVVYVGDDLADQGLMVLIAHPDGWRTAYGHLGSTTLRIGDDVRAGQALGTVGTTAGDGRPSIHFETWRMRGDEPMAVDPLTVLPR